MDSAEIRLRPTTVVHAVVESMWSVCGTSAVIGAREAGEPSRVRELEASAYD